MELAVAEESLYHSFWRANSKPVDTGLYVLVTRHGGLGTSTEPFTDHTPPLRRSRW